MQPAPRYTKQLCGFTLEYMPPGFCLPGDAALDLRVSLGQMSIEDAFQLTLPPRFSRMTIGCLLNEVFSEEADKRQEVTGWLDTKTNPDLPDMYAELLSVFDQWQRGGCTLRFFANNGPEVEPSNQVSSHLSLRRGVACPELVEVNSQAVGLPLLDIVIEQRYEILEWFAGQGDDRDALLEWLRCCTLLYFMDKHGFRLMLDPSDEPDMRLLPITGGLYSRGYIAPIEESGIFEITAQGRQLLGQMIAEAESCIDRYGVFEDVVYDADPIEFGTGFGEDLRIQVYVREGFDPVRAVFLLRLYDCTLDAYTETWRDEIHREGFFDEILRPVLDHQCVDDDLMDWIIESGYAYIEEQAEQSMEQTMQTDALRRARPPLS